MTIKIKEIELMKIDALLTTKYVYVERMNNKNRDEKHENFWESAHFNCICILYVYIYINI